MKHQIRNERVVGSNPISSSIKKVPPGLGLGGFFIGADYAQIYARAKERTRLFKFSEYYIIKRGNRLFKDIKRRFW